MILKINIIFTLFLTYSSVGCNTSLPGVNINRAVNSRKTEHVEYDCTSHSVTKKYKWGIEKTTFLDDIKVDGVIYKLENIERKIKLVDNYKKRRFIKFKSDNNTYMYELGMNDVFPYCVQNDKLLFRDEDCSESIEQVGEELLCLDCLVGRCLLIEFEIGKSGVPPRK